MDEKKFRVLAINPGGTSTKVAVFINEHSILEKTIRYDSHELKAYPKITDQYLMRKHSILHALDEEGINLSKVDAVVGRGGLLRPIEGGTYHVNDMMLEDLRNGYAGEHTSNLGGILAYEVASELNIPAFIVDPVVVDEMTDIARVSGLANIERKSIFHALNQKAASKRVAKELNSSYHELRFIVAHMGGGITVGVHEYGRVIDVNNGLHGEGPFSQERSGTVPVGDLIELCFSGQYSFDDMMQKVTHQGGLVGYLGTDDMMKVEKQMALGNQKASLIFEAMAYQIAKEIGAASVVLSGQVDAIILTGGLAYSSLLTNKIIDRVAWISDVIVHPGEDELQALSEGALRVLRDEEKAKVYGETNI